jgi:hypothetical protein
MISLEALQAWIPATMTGQERTLDSRLTGIRLPPTEAQTRAIAKRALPDVDRSLGVWLRTFAIIGARVSIERVDSLSAWENEGGQ